MNIGDGLKVYRTSYSIGGDCKGNLHVEAIGTNSTCINITIVQKESLEATAWEVIGYLEVKHDTQ